MPSNLRHLLATIALALCVLCVSAMADPSEKAKSKGLNIRTLCIAYHGEIKEIEIVQEKDERVKMPLYDDAFSPFHEYQGELPIRIYQVGADKPFATITPSGTSRDFILLFIPSKKTKGKPYQVFCMDGSDGNFRYGMRRIFNLTNTTIGLRYGNAEKSLHRIPSNFGPHDIEITSDKVKGERFPIEFFQQTNEEWKRFSATRWTVDPTKRSIVFLYRNPRTGTPTYRSIAEYKVDEDLVRQLHEANKGQTDPVLPPAEEETLNTSDDHRDKTAPPIPLPR